MGRIKKNIQKSDVQKEKIKERTFANPQTGDEAEADLPTLEQLANYDPDNKGGAMMTREQILKEGTLLEKLRLYFGSIDLSGYFEAKEQLTEEDINQIRLSIQTNKDRELTELCIKEYNVIFDFGKILSYFFKRFQVSYAVLAVLLNKWDSYNYTAKQLTRFYSLIEQSTIDVLKEDKVTGEHISVESIEIYSDETRNNLIDDLLHSNVLDDAALRFNETTKEFYVDVDTFRGLYSKISAEAKSATKDLCDFKAYAIVAKEYIKKSKLKFMPISIQLSVDSAESERYTRCLVKNLRYFRSELNRRKLSGENITPEDEKRAVIPDFCEVKPSKYILVDCKKRIKKNIEANAK